MNIDIQEAGTWMKMIRRALSAIYLYQRDKQYLVRYVEGVGANFGRVRVIRLEPQDRRVAKAMLHRDQNNRYNPDGAGWIVRSWLELSDNPDSYMMLMDSDADGYPDPTTEIRIPLHRGSRFVVDTQRLWHVVVHRGDQPRHALISSFESGPALDSWIRRNRSLPARVATACLGINFCDSKYSVTISLALEAAIKC